MAARTLNSCLRCKYYRKECESYEMPHIAWHACRKLPQRANLSSFPFAATKCRFFEIKLSPTGRTPTQPNLQSLSVATPTSRRLREIFTKGS